MTERSQASDLWLRWKRLWRRLETSDPIRRAKRLARQALGTELRYFPQLRERTECWGGWCFSPRGLSPASVVYSLGVGQDVEFDLVLIRRFGTAVHAFDPTPTAVEWVRSREFPEEFRFRELGIADFDGVAEFSPPVAGANVSYSIARRSTSRAGSIQAEVRRLRTVMAELGHSRIDLLKMDIEGAEFTVIPDIIGSGIEVRQLLVEFHHRFRGMGLERTRAAVELLLHNGFRILHISPSGREYAFLHERAVSPGAAA